jgi:competence ComEA-like helix-hairpin-helix protein
MHYSRPQLKLLLLLAATLCAGLGVREWRAGFPDLAERLERFDREPSGAASTGETTTRHGDTPAAGDSTPAIAAADTAPSSTDPTGDVDPTHVRSAAAAPGATAPPEPAAARASPPASFPADARPVDINRAGQSELARLPGVGPSMAARIVAERERRGRFDSPDALRAVLGMGPKKLAAIRELITASE